MASFPSGGAARGFTAGVALRQNKEARKQEREDAQQEAFRKSMEDARKSSVDEFDQVVKIGQESAAAGADDEQLEQLEQGAQASLARFAQTLDAIKARAVQSGAPPEQIEQIPSGEDFISQHIDRFRNSVSLGRLQFERGEKTGERSGEQKVAEARRIAEELGVPEEQVARAMNILPEDTTAKDKLALEKRLTEETQRNLKTEQGLRKEVTSLLKDFNSVADAFARVNASVSDPSAAGDLSLIFNFMKMLDPESTVREGEFATAESSGSVPARISATYNKVVSGERLEAAQRADFASRSGKLMEAAQTEAKKTASAFEQIAISAGVDVENVLAQFRARQVDIGSATSKADFTFDPETGELVPVQ